MNLPLWKQEAKMTFFLLRSLFHGFLHPTIFALGYFTHYIIKLYEENTKIPNRFAVMQIDVPYEDI